MAYSDTDIDNLVDARLPITPKHDFILWETRPPKDAKLFDVGTTPSGDADQLALFTVDSTKPCGYAITAPSSPISDATYQVGRLNAKYNPSSGPGGGND